MIIDLADSIIIDPADLILRTRLLLILRIIIEVRQGGPPRTSASSGACTVTSLSFPALLGEDILAPLSGTKVLAPLLGTHVLAPPLGTNVSAPRLSKDDKLRRQGAC